MKAVFVSTLVSLAVADMRIARPGTQKDPSGKALTVPFQMPSTFGLAALAKQKQNNNDNFCRSNTENQANQRNTATEAALDMMPCRSSDKSELQTFAPGETVTIPLRWNNPHASNCEVNLWQNNLTTVAPMMRPKACGGGYQNQQFQFTIPPDVKGCETAANGCVMQIYAHSVEPRTYAVCMNVVITGTPKQNLAPKSKFDTSVPNYQTQPAVQFNDAFDIAHLDSQYGGYHGQQPEFIDDELKAAIQLQSFVGNGGLVKLGNIDAQKNKQMRDQIQAAIKANERKATALNKLAQQQLKASAAPGAPTPCFEGELYGVVNNANCARQFTGTYVTNVGYRDIYNTFLPKLQAGGFVQYEPTIKTLIGNDTPKDEFGEFKVNGKPSLVPQGKQAAAAPKPAAKLTPGPEPASIQKLASKMKPAPLPAFIKNPAKAPVDAKEVPKNPDTAASDVNVAISEGTTPNPVDVEIAKNDTVADTVNSNGWTLPADGKAGVPGGDQVKVTIDNNGQPQIVYASAAFETKAFFAIPAMFFALYL